MNKNAVNLSLKNSHFSNPHGLSNKVTLFIQFYIQFNFFFLKANKSSAYDLGTLCYYSI